MPNLTYLDQFIADGETETISLHNLYDTTLVSNANKDHIFRIPTNDFFIQHERELTNCIQLCTLDQTMYYKPKAVSLQKYGTTELWIAILRLNNMRNITEFCKPFILLYEPNRLKEIIKIYFKRDGKA